MYSPDSRPSPLGDMRGYLGKIVPLLELWQAAFELETFAYSSIVLSRLRALLQHTEQMAVPDRLQDIHAALIRDVLRPLLAQATQVMVSGSRAARASMFEATRAGLATFQQELYCRVVAAADEASNTGLLPT
jgi:hypothetical protein